MNHANMKPHNNNLPYSSTWLVPTHLIPHQYKNCLTFFDSNGHIGPPLRPHPIVSQRTCLQHNTYNCDMAVIFNAIIYLFYLMSYTFPLKILNESTFLDSIHPIILVAIFANTPPSIILSNPVLILLSYITTTPWPRTSSFVLTIAPQPCTSREHHHLKSHGPCTSLLHQPLAHIPTHTTHIDRPFLPSLSTPLLPPSRIDLQPHTTTRTLFFCYTTLTPHLSYPSSNMQHTTHPSYQPPHLSSTTSPVFLSQPSLTLELHKTSTHLNHNHHHISALSYQPPIYTTYHYPLQYVIYDLPGETSTSTLRTRFHSTPTFWASSSWPTILNLVNAFPRQVHLS